MCSPNDDINSFFSCFGCGPAWLTVPGETPRSCQTSLCWSGWPEISSSTCLNRCGWLIGFSCLGLNDWMFSVTCNWALFHLFTFCHAAAREKGPFHRGGPDEPAGSYCQSVDAEGQAHAALVPLAAVWLRAALTPSTVLSPLQQHEVDKLYKVEHKPISSTSDQWVTVGLEHACTNTQTHNADLSLSPPPPKALLPDPTQNKNCEMDLWWVFKPYHQTGSHFEKSLTCFFCAQ